MARSAGGSRFLGGIVLGATLFGLLGCIGCQDGYPIPASQCDQWCDASQPIFCGSYDPAGCVLTCSERGGDTPECRAQLETLLRCLHGQSPRDLECETWLYTGLPPCSGEQTNYEVCAAPHAQSGFGTVNWL